MPPSSNWLALKKNFKGTGAPVLSSGQSISSTTQLRKRRKVETASESTSEPLVIAATPTQETGLGEQHGSCADRDSVECLRKMVLGQMEYSPTQILPGRYLSLDCEMVGIAGGSRDFSVSGTRIKDESSLARVSIVNYHGAVQLDVFVQQRERVTDWRTQYSGVRESDMIHAKTFAEVQKLVSDLLKDRILVGHAVHNDTKVLLLSHPHNMTRDTQILAGMHGTLTSKANIVATSSGTSPRLMGKRKPALRKLVSQELGIEIQTGEHSSIIDARATMAIYRLHRKTWDHGFLAAVSARERRLSRSLFHTLAQAETISPGNSTQKPSKNRKRDRGADSDDAKDSVASSIGSLTESAFSKRPKKPSSNRKGPNSGLSVVIKRYQGGAEKKHMVTGTRGSVIEKKSRWWGTLG